jgi:NAD(P)-dependent dehydrogenase (short-subunit alcohol dehydrogenase family)
MLGVASSMAWSAADIPDQSGKLAVVTGANGGLGLEVFRGLVSVTSTGRHNGRAIDPENPHLEGRYDPWRAYGQSKLANVHFALELDRRFRAGDVSARSVVAHPGFTNTPICRPEALWRPAAAGASGSSG